ncbi:aminopeptidase N [Brevibacterium yomogidense]|uniref:aminopeptidase N n=1 Tax=Brevibacterium yomogidense TaxID=946573 RepID=UPI001E6497D5|nr:aminopeptidase N [Brevibacterium yomogidense]
MTTNLTRVEAQTRSALLTVDHYAVDLDLSGAADPDVASFGSRTTVDMTARGDGVTFIDLIAASVRSVSINGVALRPDEVFDGARVRFPVRKGANRLIVLADAEYSRSGEGMHRFVDPADGLTYLYTQYEPTDARRVAAVFDQPDLKASYTFQVLAPAEWTVLSNTAAVSTTDLTAEAAGTHPDHGPVRLHRFAPTHPVSSYLTCVCAGPYASVTGEHRVERTGEVIPLGVHVRQSLAAHVDAEDIMRVTGQGLDFFHGIFDQPYVWGKYDQIFVPEYNLGAMENPGLVTFTDHYIHRDRATRAERESRANTILHEMAHMWFGDLVTMAWWDDLWLKESFADYMGGHALASATEYSDGWVSFALRRKDWAYRQDQYPTSHPIVADIPDVEAAKLNFDGITYAKGASVLKALVEYVGEEAFLAGSNAYFAAHAFGNARLEDFLAALDDAAPDRDVRAWAAAWLQTRGTSELTLEIETSPAAAAPDVETPDGGVRADSNGSEAGEADSSATVSDFPAAEETPSGSSDPEESETTEGADAAVPTGADVITSARLVQRDGFAPAGGAGTLRPHRLTLAAFDVVSDTEPAPTDGASTDGGATAGGDDRLGDKPAAGDAPAGRDVPTAGDAPAGGGHGLGGGSDHDRLRLTRTWDVEVTGESAELPQLVGMPRPALLLLNHGDQDYAKVRLDAVSELTAVERVADLEPLDRAVVISSFANGVRDGVMPVPAYLQAATGVLTTEDHPGILASVMATLSTALDQWVSDTERIDAVTAVLDAVLDTLGDTPAGSDRQLSLARFALGLTSRTAGARGSDRSVARGRHFANHVLATPPGRALTDGAGGLVVDHALRWMALRALVVLGWADIEHIDTEAVLDRTGSGAVNAAMVRASRPLSIARHTAWNEATRDTTLSNDMLSARISGINAPVPHPMLEDCVDDYFAQLTEFWSTRPIEISRRLVVGLYPDWSARPRRVVSRTEDWLREHADAPAAQRRLLVEALDDLNRTIRLREGNSGADASESGEPQRQPSGSETASASEHRNATPS